MLDASRLQGLSNEGLQALKAAVDKELCRRYCTRPLRGRVGTFTTAPGEVRTVMVDKVNHKTVGCTETGASLEPGKKWRVGLDILAIEPVLRAQPLPAAKRPAAPHRPASSEAAW